MSIYRSQVTDRSKSPAHADEYKKPIMEDIKVYSAMKKDYLRINRNDSIAVGMNKLRESRIKSLVVDDNGELAGYLSLENIPSDVNYMDKVESVMQTENLPVLYPNDNLHTALTKIMSESSGKLIILESRNSRKVMGTLSLQEITESYNKEIRTIKENQRKAQQDSI
jgi:Predicted transcriptional regulator, contains C-terminal CBS domains